eukprot:CAMPEP_0113643130 /NCGR_PEP_ID=MMETSP0017_2-20120614/22670_1 /TAXON_ID=2856 /ORGANISM="Cylindrotheca closterium" /LENGTH=655 /DNA_ID=CAMNT_0000554613 /DNA_START=13 /DNA_END=1977 /DNA_ORIENTATION=- /assembly_acc=CAM_ASM_000147
MTNRGFTEAVPLSLSSMAHMTLPLEEGVSDGLTQVLHHMLTCCANYARAIMPPHNWKANDLTTSIHAWEPHAGDAEPRDLPTSLTKHGFSHQYHRTAFIYLKGAMKQNISQEDEKRYLKDWAHEDEAVLGRVSLMFATNGVSSPEELNGDKVTADSPKCVLYKAIVEYRSLPATGNKSAVQAEELSMLSFGGSVDDDVKYGALASLYDDTAKYILEIYSVRGKKYKFDLMKSTLCDGTVPRMPSRGNPDEAPHDDPFLKSLCVTVTDHATSRQEEHKYAITRMHLSLEGNLHIGQHQLPTDSSSISNRMQEMFLYLNHAKPEMAVATPSGHTLLLDPNEAGKIYIDGRYVTSWGKDPKIGSHLPALFGMDLQNIPFWHGRITDYDILKRSYAQLWQDVLIDARLKSKDIGGRLLSRLITGADPVKDDEDDEDDDADHMDDEEEKTAVVDPGSDCLEAQVMQSSTYDPVGISAKALATRFSKEYCEEGFPCLAHEIDWVKDRLPGRVPVVVPLRVINVLRRGGYFDTKRTSDEVWFSQSRPAKFGDESEVVEKAVELLKEAGCNDVTPNMIVFFNGVGVSDPVQKRGLVRFNRTLRQYHVNQYFSTMNLMDIVSDSKNVEPEAKKKKIDTVAAKGYLLGFHVAQEHPDGGVLIRYL